MADNEIIRSLGFEWITGLEEWIKPMFEGKLCLWDSINFTRYYDLYYEDPESFLIPISKRSSLDDISNILKQLERHIKISELLEENKEDPFPYIIKKSLNNG